MIDIDKYMKLASNVARTSDERSIWYGLVGEVSNLYDRVNKLESLLDGGHATVTKPKAKKKVVKKEGE